MKVGIIGYGWVGKAMYKLFPESVIYDPFHTAYADISQKDKINNCDVAFICVPTPSLREGKLDTSIVEEVIKWCECSLIVIRSTVNPGDSAHWSLEYDKNIVVQPEYLGETVEHPMYDLKTRPFLIIGGFEENRRKLIDLYATVYNANITIKQVGLTEAEVIKLSENRAIAFKVAQCQELYSICERANVDYYMIRDAVYGDDPRFNLWWTFVYPDNRGVNSKCIPKDVYAWKAWAESWGYNPKITKALLEKNKEWINDKD